LSTKSSY